MVSKTYSGALLRVPLKRLANRLLETTNVAVPTEARCRRLGKMFGLFVRGSDGTSSVTKGLDARLSTTL
jgi:hypothetical protein